MVSILRVLIPLLALVILNACNTTLGDKKPIHVSLNSCEWTFSETDSLQKLPATVPGSVHMDLLNNGKINDPYFGDNEKDLQWIGERNWTYQTTFQVDEQVLAQPCIELHFDGLDTYAEVLLNGEQVLLANNYFRAWKVDVKNKLKSGINTLDVRFTSSVTNNKALRADDSIELFDDYVYTRKPAFHDGWDWGPVYITAGIWRPVYLKAWSSGKIKDTHIVQERVSKELAVCKAVVELEAHEAGEAKLTISSEVADLNKTLEVTLDKGINSIEIPFEIEKPKLWWSRGLGEAHLYTVTTQLSSGNALLDDDETVIGIRDLKLVQNPDSKGASFHFELNGIPVFAKGANYIPQESFQSRVDSLDYQTVIQHAIDANMNMLRVWGGGFYEEDYFYDLCDQNGLLVWQDFMFACSMYPGETDYLENVKQEAIENVIRLRNHPSLALWCGNNENYIGWQDWRWSNRYSKEDSASVWHDYEALFDELLPEVVKQYDADKAYWPSSPKYGWGYPVNIDGDVHLWAVWHAQDPFEVFLEEENIGRFMSEYGFQSLPEMKTIKAFTDVADRAIDSDVMKSHQKHRVGYPVIDKYIKRDYNWPKDFESYVYVSQLLQAKGIKMAVEAHRRAMPFCMGTLYWQLNDCWPVASWSSVDYYNRWKALHYKVRDAYAQVMVSTQTNNDKLDIYVVSDRIEESTGTLSIIVNDFTGQRIWSEELEVAIPVNTSEVLVSPLISKLLANHQENELVVNVVLRDDEMVLAQNEHYFVAPKDLNLKNVDVAYTLERLNDTELKIKLSTDYLAKDLCLSFSNLDGHFSNNYFDLLPGNQREIIFKSNTILSANVDTYELSTKSLVDSY
ncbi:glycoside hydrolase family 2 protein [Carboxylicivirga sp. M1479]|uniref:beta-mannosidase n=1 Tax=Carboxylicivirga sp. M1479 TaxID=2594476 RepID=UPI001177D19C|nr:glycoside hydrolase family 2 protein [Carboxylicivirga sp. M1479]TRX70215.1 glycoside hydrolase family 2 protein [Carboxylicivirga sp. M1479]